MFEIVDAGTISGTYFKIKMYQLVPLSKLLVNLLASIMYFICNFLNSHSVFTPQQMYCSICRLLCNREFTKFTFINLDT